MQSSANQLFEERNKYAELLMRALRIRFSMPRAADQVDVDMDAALRAFRPAQAEWRAALGVLQTDEHEALLGCKVDDFVFNWDGASEGLVIGCHLDALHLKWGRFSPAFAGLSLHDHLGSILHLANSGATDETIHSIRRDAGGVPVTLNNDHGASISLSHALERRATGDERSWSGRDYELTLPFWDRLQTFKPALRLHLQGPYCRLDKYECITGYSEPMAPGTLDLKETLAILADPELSDDDFARHFSCRVQPGPYTAAFAMPQAISYAIRNAPDLAQAVLRQCVVRGYPIDEHNTHYAEGAGGYPSSTTFLHDAVMKGRSDLVEWLLAHGSDPHSKARFALDSAMDDGPVGELNAFELADQWPALWERTGKLATLKSLKARGQVADLMAGMVGWHHRTAERSGGHRALQMRASLHSSDANLG